LKTPGGCGKDHSPAHPIGVLFENPVAQMRFAVGRKIIDTYNMKKGILKKRLASLEGGVIKARIFGV